MDELIACLKGNDLFSDFSEALIRDAVLPHRQMQEYRKGVLVIAPQQRVNRFGIVLAGKIL